MNNEINLFLLVLHASLPVQLVMVLLLIASVASWFILFRKKRVLDRTADEAESFEEKFWSGIDLDQLYREVSAREVNGLEAIFEAGFRDFTRLRTKPRADARTQLDGAQHAIRPQPARVAIGRPTVS